MSNVTLICIKTGLSGWLLRILHSCYRETTGGLQVILGFLMPLKPTKV